MLFQLKLKQAQLADYDQLLDINVNVLAITITAAGLQADWEIRLSGSAATLLRSGRYLMPAPPQIVSGIQQFFYSVAPTLLAQMKSTTADPEESISTTQPETVDPPTEEAEVPNE